MTALGRRLRPALRLAVLVATLLGVPVLAAAQPLYGFIDTPTANATVAQPFSISGWAIWQNTGAGPGIDAVHVYGCPINNCGTMTFWGAATYGLSRADVATYIGHARYTNSGYTFTKAGLASDTYYVQVWVRNTENYAWHPFVVTFTVNAAPEHTLEAPTQGQALPSPVSIQGWAVDASAPSGTGVSAISVWSHRNPGSGEPGVWHGYGTYGANRPDVAASHGERFRYSGYTGSFSLGTGQHFFGVSSLNTVSQTWLSQIRTIYVGMTTVPLTVDRPGTGTGGVTASGFSCAGGSTTQALPCGASYPLHTVVTLTAVPDANATFSGWGGACTGTGTCQVTLSMARLVTATFAKNPSSIATRYYHTDVVGSVRAITDAAGNLVTTAGAPSGRHDYRPFGENTNPMTGDPIRFAGKELDPETAQQYFDARYYRNTWGRFTQVDPLHVGAAMTDPQQWNRYAYARNNPLRWTDPTGLCVQYSGPQPCFEGSSAPWEWILTDNGFCARLYGGACEFVDFENLDWMFPIGGAGNGAGDDQSAENGVSATVPTAGTPQGGTTSGGTTNGGNGTGCTQNCGTTTTVEPQKKPCTGAAAFGSLFDVGNVFGIRSGFGPRVHPITGEVGKPHTGLDILSPQGTRLISPIDGEVQDSAFETNGGGNTIRVRGTGAFRGYTAGFGHLSRLDVSAGETVTMGATLGLTGGLRGTPGAGGSTGAHLHFSVKVGGAFIDPAPCY